MVGEETSMSSIAFGSSNIDDWDSLEHINLVVAVERCFGIKFNMGEVSTIKNVGAMVDIILERMQLKIPLMLHSCNAPPKTATFFPLIINLL